MKLLKTLTCAFLSTLLAACSDSDSDGGGSAKLSYSVQASLASSTATANSLNSFQGRAVPDCDAPTNYPVYSTDQGASGAPDEMTLYLRSIELTSSESSDRATLFDANSSTGDKIVISGDNNGTVSLADLDTSVDVEPIEGEDGELIEVDVPTGSFNQMSITFRNAADIKGCITENWSENGGFSCTGADEDLCDPLPSQGEHTVCTVEDLSIFDLVDTSGAPVAAKTAGFNAYKDATPAATRVSLAQRAGDSDTPFNPDGDVTFNIDMDEITITDGDALDLTLAIDLNLLLRFDGNTRSDNESGTRVDVHPLKNVMAGNGTIDYAYFHTIYLPDVMGVYIGKPGSVQGYAVESCYNFDGDTNDTRSVDSWMTVIFDENDNLLTGFITPKSDAGFVLLKGNINPTDAGTRPTVSNSDGSYDLLLGTESFSGGLQNWSPIATVDDSETLGTDDVSPTAQSASSDTQEATWHYIRKL